MLWLEIWKQCRVKCVASLRAQLILIQMIKEGQLVDTELQVIREQVEQGVPAGYSVHSDGLLKFGTWMCILNDTKLRQEILKEAHNTRFIIHLGSTKMYHNLQ